ncbi:HipA domain-containing protein [Terrimonas pollutisoli]|uniref:HipA domain-containing protein n=1 Tax=Terrimonas pollutisoli TaxID=3034147 RepID=UPI0023EAF597|nr:HipA domain-containing protein [Terrimonas sp. H1YJ31]
MTMCPGCYRPDIEGYCLNCRKQLFDGAKVSHVLPFDTPKADNLPLYQEKTKRLSISGVQLKYSLRLEGKELKLVEKGGQYILKPIPPTVLIVEPGQAPENEHLTMQIASQVFGIKTAANALIYFKDGTPAYITRRFDVKPDGNKYLQEDMAQISGRSRQSRGENFKYEGTYEEIGQLIRQHVAAYPPALENYFRLVLFNYLFSNGDAHLKNFSLIQTDMGDYTLTPAYDLMCTVLHTPNETDTALDMYKGDIDSNFYNEYGFFGQPNFRELAEKLSIQPIRTGRILTQLLTHRGEVTDMIQQSFLSEEVKVKYLNAHQDKLRRMGMTKDMIASAINPEYPGVYAPTNAPTKLTFRDGSAKVGYFQHNPDMDKLEAENKYTFIEFKNRHENDPFTIIEGDQMVNLEYPSV